MSDAIRWYEAHAEELSCRHESLSTEKVHAWLAPSLPGPPPGHSISRRGRCGRPDEFGEIRLAASGEYNEIGRAHV
jgi:hypothetical protein